MQKKQRTPGEAKKPVLKEIPRVCIDETPAVEFMEKQRWGSRPACPRCGDTDVAQVKDSNGGRSKRFLWRCHGCKKQFTVRLGTVFEDSRIPLRIWCYAFWRACASKKGISSLQISRECHITYKSALFLMHRIRYAMSGPKQHEKLRGTVEADEAYCAGKPRRKGQSKRGRGTSKTPVVAVVQRGGDVRAQVVANVTAKTLRQQLHKNVDLSARLLTDDLKGYRKIGREFPGGHEFVRHSYGKYVCGDIHTNTIEGVFALIKRGLYGTFHAVSKKHLHRYVSEFEFKYNARRVNDGERVAAAIKGDDGKSSCIVNQPKKVRDFALLKVNTEPK